MGRDIESGLEEENLDNPGRLRWFLRKLLWLIREKTLLGSFLSSAIFAVLISLIILLLLFAFPPTSTKLMLLLGEKLGVLAFWTLVDSYPAAVSIVVAEVYISVFAALFVTQLVVSTGVRIVNFYRPPPSLAELLKQDVEELGDTMANIYANNAHQRANPVLEQDNSAKRVRFFEGKPIVHTYESEDRTPIAIMP